VKSNLQRPASNGKAVTSGQGSRGRRHVRHRGLIVFAVAAIATLAIGLGVAGLYYNHLLNMIHYETSDPNPTTQTWPSTAPTTRRTTRKTSAGETTVETTIDWASKYDVSDIPLRSDPDVQNILLIGWDDYGNADTIILSSIDKKGDTLRMVSILRDTGVLIPGYPHGDIPKINAAYAYGGAPLLIETIEKNFRIDIDNYVSVDFDGFDSIVDSIGGIDVELTAEEAAHLGLEPGMQHLNGFWVEEYVRIRKIDSDYQRTSRQRYVLERMLAKARNMGALELASLMDKILPQVHTGLSKSELSSLLLAAPSMLNYPLEQDSLPLHGTYESYDYTFHLFDLAGNVRHLQEFLYGS